MQTKRAASQAGSANAPAIVDEVLRAPGTSLDAATRAFMEPRFGHDFSRVRVHADTAAAESARAVSARAYTVGNDLVFGLGHYAPGTVAGQRLLAHELTHVVQQSGGDERSPGPRGGHTGRSSAEQRRAAVADGAGKHSPRRDATVSAKLLQRDATDDLAAVIARDLGDYVARHADPYEHIKDVFRQLNSDIEDNVAAAFTERLDDARLQRFAADKAGLATLNVLTEAMLTGSVSLFESRQAERILIAKRNNIPQEEYVAEAQRIAGLRHRAQPAYMLSDDQKAERIAEDLKAYAAAHLYGHITAVFDDLPSDIEDNVAADFVASEPDAKLAEFAASGGDAMLDVLTEAMITGHVTAFESLQAERILLAKAQPRRPGEAQPLSAETYTKQAERIAELRDRAEDSSIFDKAVDQGATEIAHELNALAAQRRYRDIMAKMQDLSSDIEDNVASHFVELQPPARLEEFAADPDGRSMLDVLYAATVTGDVTAFERLQTDRILEAKAKVAPKPDATVGDYVGKHQYQQLYIFPVRMQKAFRSSYAIPKATLQPDGKVRVSYDDQIHFFSADMFKEDIEKLSYSRLSSGIELDPDELVFVKLYDDNERIVPVPALALIDYSNQAKRQSVNVGVSAFQTGLFLGLGGLGAFSGARVGTVAVEVEAGEASVAAYNLERAGLWADRVAAALPVVTFVVDENRDWILKNFPNAGPILLDALDQVNKLTEYYGWARMGIDGARYLKSKLGPALERWRAEAGAAHDLTSSQRRTIEGIDRTLADVQANLEATEAKAAADMAKRVDQDPGIAVSGEAGHRTAKVDGHEVKEEVEAATGAVHCAVHSDGGIPVDCPERFSHGEPQKEAAAEANQPQQEGQPARARVPGSRLSDVEQQRLDVLTNRRKDLLEQRVAISEDLRNDAESLKQANRQPPSKQRDQAVAEARAELQRDRLHQTNNEAALERNAAEINSASKSFAQQVSSAVDEDPVYRAYRERAQKARIDGVTRQTIETGQSIEVDHLVSRDEVGRRPGVNRLDPEVVAGILNREDNLVPMLAGANSSKGPRSYMSSAATDREFWSNASIYYTDDQIAAMAVRENTVRKQIFDALDAEIAKLPRR